MVTLHFINDRGHLNDVAVLDFPNIGEAVKQILVHLRVVSGARKGSCSTHLRIVPVQLANEFEHLVKGALRQNVVEKMCDEALHWGLFDDFPNNPLRWVALWVGPADTFND